MRVVTMINLGYPICVSVENPRLDCTKQSWILLNKIFIIYHFYFAHFKKKGRLF